MDNGESRVRAAGVFGNSTGFGGLLAMWTATCGMMTLSDRRPNKLALAVILLTALVGLVCSTSRVSLASMFAGIGTGTTLLFANHVRQRGFRLSGSTMSLAVIAVVVIIATVCLVIPQLMDQEWLNATYSRFDPRAHRSSNGFLTGRLTIWREYFRSINEWGVFGVGYKQGHLQFAMAPHNQFLSLAAECGFLCLCMFLLFVANIAFRALASRIDRPLESMMCLTVMAAFVADGMGGEPLGSWQVTPVTMILLGICVGQFARKDRSRES